MKNKNLKEEDLKLEFLPGEVDIQLIEDDEEGEDSTGKKKSKKAHICLIKAGWNANDYYFEESNLTEILQLMTGKPKLYVDHDFFGMGRSEKDWAASYINSKKDGNKLVGDIVFTNNPLTSWLYEEIERAPKEVQLSIDIRAIVEDMDTPDGRTGRKVSKVLAYRSTDFVSYAAAGGEALNVFNSMIKKEIDSINEKLKLTKENTKMDITLAKLKAENPELITELKKEFENGNQVTDLQNSLNAVNTKLTGLEAQVATLTADKATLSLTIETLQNEKKTIETDRDGLKLKLDEIETTQKVAKWKSDIQNAITESKIDSKLVTAVFLEVLEKETDIEKVKTMIEDRKSIADPKFSIDNGGPAGDDKPVVITDESLIESIKS